MSLVSVSLSSLSVVICLICSFVWLTVSCLSSLSFPPTTIIIIYSHNFRLRLCWCELRNIRIDCSWDRTCGQWVQIGNECTIITRNVPYISIRYGRTEREVFAKIGHRGNRRWEIKDHEPINNQGREIAQLFIFLALAIIESGPLTILFSYRTSTLPENVITCCKILNLSFCWKLPENV